MRRADPSPGIPRLNIEGVDTYVSVSKVAFSLSVIRHEQSDWGRQLY